MLDVAIELVEDPAQPVVTVGHGNPEWFVDVVLKAVGAKRPAIVLGECTIPWLYNFGLGAQAATRDHFAPLASERDKQLARFESWLQDYFEVPGVPWQRILRAFEGPGEAAVYRFAALWEEHLNS